MPKLSWMVLITGLIGALFAFEPAWAQTDIQPNQGRILLTAKLKNSSKTIESGLQWQIFGAKLGADGEYPLLAKAVGGSKAFDMSLGDYLVHVSYGRVNAAQRITVKSGQNALTFSLDAGGLYLNARTGKGQDIDPQYLRFNIFKAKADNRGIRPLIAQNIAANHVVTLPPGTYHVVSKYGKLNAETRADLRVESGKLTQAIMQQRAAKISFLLVRQSGGEALADTAWSILAENGDEITQMNTNFPSVILSEGSYTVVARNDERIYSKDFTVESGLDKQVEVLIIE